MSSTLNDPAYRAFVTHLAGLRIAAGLSQRQLAERMGRHYSWIAKSERFERRLDPAEFRAIVLALGGDPAAEFAAVSAVLEGVSGKYSGK